MTKILPVVDQKLLNLDEVDNSDGKRQETLDDGDVDGVDARREDGAACEHEDDDDGQNGVGLERRLGRVELGLDLGELDHINPLSMTFSGFLRSGWPWLIQTLRSQDDFHLWIQGWIILRRFRSNALSGLDGVQVVFVLQK